MTLICFFQTYANFFIWFLFNLFLVFSLFAAFMVVFSLNPVSAVLYLILVFVSVAFLFILAGAEFLGIILIIVYVGAIAVLFLFAVMMLNINRTEFVGMDTYFLGSTVLVCSFFYVVRKNLVEMFVFPDIIKSMGENYVDWAALLTWKTNVEVLGGLIYTYYAHLFVLAGFILLVAMVASIVLTLGSVQIKHDKVQNKHEQIKRAVLKTIKLRS